MPGHPYEQGFDLRVWPQRLEPPLRRRRPRMICVNSMSDLFHEDIPDDVDEHLLDVKLGARSRSQAIARAVRQGLILSCTARSAPLRRGRRGAAPRA